MIIESKYDINQTVWLIQQEKRKEFVSCKACGGEGRIVLADKVSRSCPECYGKKGSIKYHEMEWTVAGSLTIGQVRAEITNIEKNDIFNNIGHFKDGSNEEIFQYMAYETGIRSGTVYYQEYLFPSQHEAQNECNTRNLEVKK